MNTEIPQFHVNCQTQVGNGLFRNLHESISQLGFKKPALLIDEGFLSTELCKRSIAKLEETFGSKNVNVHPSRGTQEPTYNYVDEVTDLFRQWDFDILVGVGGGSCLDLAKGIAGLKTNSGKALEYRGFDKLENANIPTLLIPTTAGTGSEITPNASYVDTDSKLKLGVNGRYMSANYIMLDGEVTVSCPYRAALGSGIDAVVHALESFACKKSNPLTRQYAYSAIKLLFETLPTLKSDPGNLDARLNQLIGAYFAAISLYNSGSGIAGGLSYPLGVHYSVPHGLAGGIFCLGVVAYNIEEGFYEYAELASAVGVTKRKDPKEKAELFLQAMQELFDDLGVPRQITELGVTSDEYENLVEKCSILQGAFDQNPIPFSVEAQMPTFIKSYF